MGLSIFGPINQRARPKLRFFAFLLFMAPLNSRRSDALENDGIGTLRQLNSEKKCSDPLFIPSTFFDLVRR
ncbi:hypothetical protein ACS0TY_019444 [Phlomoides rotata]